MTANVIITVLAILGTGTTIMLAVGYGRVRRERDAETGQLAIARLERFAIDARASASALEATTATNRSVDSAVADVKAERDAAWTTARERAAAKRARLDAMPAIARDRIVPGVLVGDRRDRAGKVLRVNAKTVTVWNGVGEQRLALDDIVLIAREDQP